MNRPNLPTDDLPSSMGTYLSVEVLSTVRPRYNLCGSSNKPSSGMTNGEAEFFRACQEYHYRKLVNQGAILNCSYWDLSAHRQMDQ